MLIETGLESLYFSVFRSKLPLVGFGHKITVENRANKSLINFYLNLEGVLLSYQLVMNLLLRKVFTRHILKTRPAKDRLFAQVCSIEESYEVRNACTVLTDLLQ